MIIAFVIHDLDAGYYEINSGEFTYLTKATKFTTQEEAVEELKKFIAKGFYQIDKIYILR